MMRFALRQRAMIVCVGAALVSITQAGCDRTPQGDDTMQDMHTKALAVVATLPADAAVNVAIADTLQIEFSGPVELTEVASFTLNPPVSGVLEVDALGTTMTFTPDAALMRATTYRATLGAGSVVAQGGTSFDEAVSWSFSTANRAAAELRDSYQSEDGTKRVTVEVSGEAGAVRAYEMVTTAALRDNDPADGRVSVEELLGQPVVRSGSVMFDALFALSVQEARQNSVSSISDGAFNHGQGVPCECFETGAKWNYVWTRDTAYAVDLGLALLDPERSRASMEFKLSQKKGQGPETVQIVQDTGSGGSWPVSTDRVVWAIGAEALLHTLDGESREAFAERTLTALVNTAEQDRASVFDERDGLYRGEQSFLDWREQSYPTWTAQDTVHLAMSKTLSTNVGHLRLLELLVKLAEERGEQAAVTRYKPWADSLRAAINEQLWLEEQGLYSSIKLNDLAPQALRKYDLLGESLAVLSGVSDDARSARVVASYPHVPMGPAVLWPQQPLIPIYHNRGIWPFVTAYGLFAAQDVGNAEVFDLDLESLIRGAAYNLSNMENFEFTSQEPYYDDGAYSGPVVNSRRQLWSVAGYFGAIVRGVFGVKPGWDGLRIEPFMTAWLHEAFFSDSNALTLSNLTWRGHRITITLELPEQVGSGAYRIASLSRDGEVVDAGHAWASAELGEEVRFDVTLVADDASSGGDVMLVEDFDDYRELWAPREPRSPVVALNDGRLEVSVFGPEGEPEQGVVYDIMRDGERVASGVGTGTWRDEQSEDFESRSYCYSVEARFVGSGHASHPSRPICFWGEDAQSRVQIFELENFAAGGGGAWSMMHGRAHYENWGDVGHELVIQAWRPERSGEHLIQLVYGNGSGGFNTGITAAVKTLIVEDAWSGEEIEQETIVMPQLADWSSWGESSFALIHVEEGRTYRLRLVDGINMSYFEHFVPYTGGTGGGEERFNRANITQLKVLPLEGQPEVTEPRVIFDGSEDLGKLSPDQQVEPGAPLEPWSRWGLEWDDRFLYVALVSPLFQDDFKAAMVYIEPVLDERPESLTRQGVDYSGQRAVLPLDASYMISWRWQQSGAAGDEPWSGVYTWRDGSWQRVWGMTPGEHLWGASDRHTMSVRVPLGLFGPARRWRLVGHAIHGEPGEEWKELLPASHTPWDGGGGAIEIDLDGAHGQENWMVETP